MAGLESEPRPSKRKRHQYTRRACNGCKVRKVKCSGVVPCSRCADTGTDCIYFDSTTAAHEIGSIEINKIRRVDALPSDRLQNLERFVRVVQEGLSQVATTSSIPFGGPSESQRIPPSPALTDLPSKNKSRLWTRRRWSSPFARKVPTSFEAMLKLAQSSFVEDIIPNINEETTSLNSHTPPIEDEETAVALVHAGHAILALGRSTALSLVDAFASHVGVMYPCVDMASTQSNIVCLFDLKSNSARGTIPSLRLIDIEILKAIMMVGASAKCSEPSSLAEHLEQSLSWSVENVCSQELLGLEDAIMSCLMCIYFLQRDEREKAWRMAGFSARTVSELGLDAHEPPEAHSWHKSDSDFESNESFDLRCRLLYCCVYDLDSWCSFLTGLPRVLSLRLPPDHLGYLQSRSHNFLRAMLEMDSIGADIIDFLKEPDQAADPHGTRMDYLEFRLKNMECASLGDTLSRKEAQDWAMPTALQLFIQLRANHLRLSTQLRSLASARMAAIRPRAVKALVSAASDNIWVCKAMESESMPTLLRPTFVHFLMGAVSGMLLAASYDPIMYGFNSRHPFKTALEMLETLSDKFRGVDPQQQYSVADLRKLGQKFGIVDEDASDHGSLNEDSALNPLIALGLQNASSDATIEQSWDASCEDPFTIGGINAQLQWEEERFDFVFNDYGAEAHDSGLYST